MNAVLVWDDDLIEIGFGRRMFEIFEKKGLSYEHSPSGIDNISVDIILSFDKSSNQNDIVKLIKLFPEHISLYNISIEKKTKLHKIIEAGEYKPISEERMNENYLYAVNKLKNAGYIHYEISNLAKSERMRSRHNINCWKHNEYIGIGINASGYLKCKRYSNTPNIKEFIKMVQNGRRPATYEEEIDRQKCLSEEIMLGLRMLEGLDIKAFNEKHGIDIRELIIKSNTERYFDINNKKIAFNYNGILISDYLILNFIELAEKAVKKNRVIGDNREIGL